ncbi:3-phosphoshikimate 1-carboxyvinyltransferase [Olsenella sp. HMSC062G07]|uniref:3-phosphoshikimate 1-carboxyvinyltransferase n=1 Tax=Olsenella sp. HMSC062G07 TaxID=1739330 RepID=UPI0008A4571D|nr:3-phosphoshikimate 1-carboxyvinyltransferase [Olsenella sp. HMSC062G07]OFK24321.1 3-phosphoshikimate 1-carboxyvinyltransferase [Olsenella sp. HMSC062G07]
MDVRICPHPLSGSLDAIASKSMAHRLLLLAAFADAPCDLRCSTSSKDIDATVRCLEALGARVARTRRGFVVQPVRRREGVPVVRAGAVLDCGESGSTLRFMLPVLAALGTSGSLVGRGRLAQRPLSPLYERLTEHGVRLGPQGELPLAVRGRLRGGRFELPGDVSSQFVSGLLLASAVMGDPLVIAVRRPVESLSYLHMTIEALRAFGIDVVEGDVKDGREGHLVLRPSPAASPVSPGELSVEGDWSCAGFWVAAGALGRGGVTVRGLTPASSQGDRVIVDVAAAMGARASWARGALTVRGGTLRALDVDVADIPDLAAPIAAQCAYASGTSHLSGAARLRLKESDRIASIRAALAAMGADVTAERDSITVRGVPALAGGVVDAANDHRIAMMAAVAAAYAQGPTTIRGAECVAKSYPGFFDDFRELGGIAENCKE